MNGGKIKSGLAGKVVARFMSVQEGLLSRSHRTSDDSILCLFTQWFAVQKRSAYFIMNFLYLDETNHLQELVVLFEMKLRN